MKSIWNKKGCIALLALLSISGQKMNAMNAENTWFGFVKNSLNSALGVANRIKDAGISYLGYTGEDHSNGMPYSEEHGNTIKEHEDDGFVVVDNQVEDQNNSNNSIDLHHIDSNDHLIAQEGARVLEQEKTKDDQTDIPNEMNKDRDILENISIPNDNHDVNAVIPSQPLDKPYQLCRITCNDPSSSQEGEHSEKGEHNSQEDEHVLVQEKTKEETKEDEQISNDMHKILSPDIQLRDQINPENPKVYDVQNLKTNINKQGVKKINSRRAEEIAKATQQGKDKKAASAMKPVDRYGNVLTIADRVRS